MKMKQGRKLGFLLSLALVFSTAAAAEEAPAEFLLLARAGVSPAVPPDVTQARKESEKPFLVSLLQPGLRSSLKGGLAELRFEPHRAETLETPTLGFTLQKETPRVALVSPLPQNLPPQLFRQSRLRGPFEQVQPRPW